MVKISAAEEAKWRQYWKRNRKYHLTTGLTPNSPATVAKIESRERIGFIQSLRKSERVKSSKQKLKRAAKQLLEAIEELTA